MTNDLSNELLLLVAKGEQAKAETILKKNTALISELLVNGGDVTDYSGRKYTNISAFQYALWALDTHMWRMILHYLPKDQAVKEALKNQYLAVEKDGVSYELRGEIHNNQHHFDGSTLTTALQAYIANYDGWNWPQREEHWCGQVGMAQRDVPAHVAQEYCHPGRSFYPTPEFNEKTLERSLNFFNDTAGMEGVVDTWWPASASASSGLGVDFGIWRERADDGAHGVEACGRGKTAASIDLAAVTALCNVRTADLKEALGLLS